jgi:Phospholipase_D-nuclease N-terminal
MQVHGSAPDLRVVLLTMVLALILDLGVAMYFIQDLYQPDRRVRGGDKQFWLVVILLGSVLGWLAYLLYGREE